MTLKPVHERWLVILIAVHSYGIAAVLIGAPGWGAPFGGWQPISPVFFAHQAGAFHLVLATAYLLEHFRYRGVTILVTAKTLAVIFLSAEWLLADVPWSVPLSALVDGAMAVAAFLVHRAVSRPE